MSRTTTSAYRKTVLPNGMRVITETIPSVRSITMGVWIDVGSRNESKDENGVSHLIEHMLFKGTKTRTSKEIASSLESIGGSLNAFTSREQTCYTARILDEHLEEAIDVLSDITCNATLTPINLKREKKVVCEEIIESHETPSDLIHDIFAETYWGDIPLGRPILGEYDNIMSMPRSKIIKYLDKNYRSESVVVAASGSISHTKLVKLVKEKFNFKHGKANGYIRAEADSKQRINIVSNDNNQIHLSFGFPGLDYSSKEKITALTAHVLLGGGMSSTLFQKIREVKGLAYTIFTFLDIYRDAGVFGAYMATDKKNLKEAVDITLKQFDQMKKYKIAEPRLAKVKAQLKGQLTLGMESTSSRMNRMARNEIMLGTYTPLKDTLKAIDKVTANDVLDISRRLFDRSRLALAVLGPADKDDLKDVL